MDNKAFDFMDALADALEEDDADILEELEEALPDWATRSKDRKKAHRLIVAARNAIDGEDDE